MLVPEGAVRIGLVQPVNPPYSVISRHSAAVLVPMLLEPHVRLIRPVSVDCTRLLGRLDWLLQLVGGVRILVLILHQRRVGE